MKRNGSLTTPNTQQSLVLSYLGLRKGIGVIGCALPIVLVFGRMTFEGPGILDSISAYYYSVMRDVFVGSLWAMAIFLLSYRYAPLDDILADFAGLFAIGVAIFPTAPGSGATDRQVIIGWLHLGFAACFFLILAFFALFLFRQTGPGKLTPKKRQRNRVYVVCGIAIVVCLVLIALVQSLPGNLSLQPPYPVVCLETLATWAFGVAWAVKGQTLAILNDDEQPS